jgi:hypothetical protein
MSVYKEKLMQSRNLFVIAATAFIVMGAVPSWAQTDKNTPPPDWIADAKTGCKVWNPAPQQNEAIHWSGGCSKDGYAQGKGTLEWSENGRAGDRYVGEYEDGKRNGHGAVVDEHGNRVEGDWHDDILLQMGGNEI